MNHCVAVRAYRTKVSNWVQFIFSADRCNRAQMVHVNKSRSAATVEMFKIEFANKTKTASAPLCNTTLACAAVSLKCVDRDSLSRPFSYLLSRRSLGNFFRKFILGRCFNDRSDFEWSFVLFAITGVTQVAKMSQIGAHCLESRRVGAYGRKSSCDRFDTRDTFFRRPATNMVEDTSVSRRVRLRAGLEAHVRDARPVDTLAVFRDMRDKHGSCGG